jgi:hypothetical protein
MERDTKPHRVISITATSESYIGSLVAGAADALDFERAVIRGSDGRTAPRAAGPAWHDVRALTHTRSDEEVFDADGTVLPRPEPFEDDESDRMSMFGLTEGITPNRTQLAWVRRAAKLGWPLLYFRESPSVPVPPEFPSAPTVTTTARDTIAETVRVWVRTAMQGRPGRELYIPDSGIVLHPGVDVRSVAGSLRVVNQELLAWVRREPHLMHELHPRAFEELVAELLHERGYEVSLTPFTRDGGRDVLALRHDDLGEFLVYVECKKHKPEALIGPDVVRALYGVVAADNASAGLLATTSSFTPGARAFQRQVANRLALRDFFDLSLWLSERRARHGRK